MAFVHIYFPERNPNPVRSVTLIIEEELEKSPGESSPGLSYFVDTR